MSNHFPISFAECGLKDASFRAPAPAGFPQGTLVKSPTGGVSLLTGGGIFGINRPVYETNNIDKFMTTTRWPAQFRRRTTG